MATSNDLWVFSVWNMQGGFRDTQHKEVVRREGR